MFVSGPKGEVSRRHAESSATSLGSEVKRGQGWRKPGSTAEILPKRAEQSQC